jgi:ribosomal protein S20
MKKKTVAIVLALALIFTAVATTVVVAQDEPAERQQIMQQALFQEVRAAVQQGLITRDTASRIVEAWYNSSEDGLSQLYQRVMNMLESKKQQLRMESSLFGELDLAVRQGLITQDKAEQIKDLWQQKPQEERLKLYQRVMGFLESGR